MRHKMFLVKVLAVIVASAVAGMSEAADAAKQKRLPPKPAAVKHALVKKQLTSGVVDDGSPCWSPDGKQIAFQRNWQIWVMNADGSGQCQLTKGPLKSGAPVWSPDGKLIAFQSNRRCGQDIEKGGNWDIWLMDKDGELSRLLAGDKGNEECPNWSPDGQRVSFHYRRVGTGHEIYTVDIEGNVVGHPTIGQCDDRFAAWSPRGRGLAFASAQPCRAGKQSHIVILDMKTQRRIQLTQGEFCDSRPCWAPDGQRLAFESNRSGNLDLWLVDLQKRTLTQLTDSPTADGEPSWSADGERIAYSSRSEKGAHIWVLTLRPPSAKP